MFESLFNKVAGLQVSALLKKRLQYRCFPVKFEKFLRKLFYRTPTVAVSKDMFPNTLINPFHPSAAFNIETSYLICNAN